MSSRLADIARATIAAHAMFEGADVLLTMVSGGADSVALLRLLAAGGVAAPAPAVLHVDHGLRPESPEDAAWVRALCDELGVACRVVSRDVGALAAESGRNVEDEGRRVRYEVAEEELAGLCDEAGVPPERGRIATAHTLDDAVETLLMRLVEGSGAGGLAGIPAVRGRVVRPLIDARRADVVAYLEELGQEWREDASNLDTSRFRAKVRHDVLPLLRELNPRFVEAAGRTMKVLADDDALLGEMADAFAEDFDVSGGEGVALDLALMRTLSRPMARRVLRAAIGRSFPDCARVEFEHLDAIVDGMGEDRFSRDVTGGLRVTTEYGKMVILRVAEGKDRLESALLRLPGSADLGPVGRLSAVAADPDDVSEDPLSATIDADRVSGQLAVGPAEEGDRMRPLGMRGRKKLSDLLAEARVPARRRGLVPVVKDRDEVVWLAGVRLSEDYRVRTGTERALRLTWHKGETCR